MPRFKGASFLKIGVDDSDPNRTIVTFLDKNETPIAVEIRSSDLLPLNAAASSAIPFAIKEGAEGVTGELSTAVHYYEVGYIPKTGQITLGLVTKNGLRFSFFVENDTAKALLGNIQDALNRIQKPSSSKPTRH